MKQVLLLIAVLFAGVGYSQNKPVGGSKWVVFKPEVIKQVTQVKAGPARSEDTFRIASVFETDPHQIMIGSKKYPYKDIRHDKYTLTLNGKPQTKRNGDTLTIIDKTIRFVVVDGVTYEIIRNTEVKKVETHVQEWPLNLHNIPFQRDTSYKGLRIGINGITLTPAVFY